MDTSLSLGGARRTRTKTPAVPAQPAGDRRKIAVEPLAVSLVDGARIIGMGRTKFLELLDVEDGIPTLRVGTRRLVRMEALREFLLRRERDAISAR